MGRTACTEPQCLYKGDLDLYLFSYVSQRIVDAEYMTQERKLSNTEPPRCDI